MRNTITLNGIASTTIAGLLIQELPAISKPLMRTTIEEIDGRDGDIVTELGYSAYDKEITIGLYGSFDINAVIAYFATEGTVVFSNEPDKFYRYKIIDQIDYERLVRYRTATVKLHCQPFKYPTSETPVQLGSGQTVTAEGTDLTMQGTALAPFVSITPKGDTFQQTYTGKNLFDKDTIVTGPLQPDGTVGTGSTQYGTSDFIPITPNTTYYKSRTDSARFKYFLSDKTPLSNAYDDIANAGNAQSFTTPANAYYIRFTMLKTLADAVQVELGSTATEYEPYTGGIPAPNPDYPQDVQVVTGEQTVKVSGKNLLQNTLITAPVTKNGVTITPNTDGTFTLNGTCTGSAWTNFANDKIYPDMGPNAGATGMQTVDGYTLSWAIDTGKIRITHANSSGNWGLQIISGSVYNNATVKYQLEAGTTATDWQPYQSQEYEVNLLENLYDKDSAVKSGSDIHLDISVQPNTTYIFKTGKAWTGAFLYDSNNTRTRKVGNDASLTHSVEFTTAANEVRAVLTFYGGSSFDIQTYDFSHIFFYVKNSIELCKIGDYQDYFYKNGGNWYKHEEIKKTEYTSVSLQQFENNTYNKLDRPNDAIIGYPENVTATSNMGAGNEQNQAWNSPIVGLFSHAATTRWWLGFGKVVNATEATEIMAKGCVVYYALATPVDTQITDSTLISQLEALANANSYRGTTHITTASDGTDLLVILAVTATGKADGTVTNAGNTYAKPKLTIYGTGNIGIYLNGSQMFQIELGSEGHITIDTEKMEAYKDTESNLKNRLVTGEYSKFRLEAGANQINFSGNINKCVVENYTRWL